MRLPQPTALLPIGGCHIDFFSMKNCPPQYDLSSKFFDHFLFACLSCWLSDRFWILSYLPFAIHTCCRLVVPESTTSCSILHILALRRYVEADLQWWLCTQTSAAVSIAIVILFHAFYWLLRVVLSEYLCDCRVVGHSQGVGYHVQQNQDDGLTANPTFLPSEADHSSLMWVISWQQESSCSILKDLFYLVKYLFQLDAFLVCTHMLCLVICIEGVSVTPVFCYWISAHLARRDWHSCFSSSVLCSVGHLSSSVHF